MYYKNESLLNLDRKFDQNERKGYLRLDLNENPGGLDKEFINSVLEKVTPEFLSQYPETLEFTELLANYHKTDIENICLTNGSAEAIRYVIEAFTSNGGNILGVVPTYAMFEVYSNMYGRKFIPIEYNDDLTMPVEKILEKMEDNIELLIMVNPNNPVGNVYSDDDFELILNKAKQREITILIDEAYHYFYPKSFINYALTNDNIYVTRTFSKLFSLAGCRLGYIVGCKQGIELIQKLCTPHNVNAFAMLFAKQIIETDGMIDNLIKLQAQGKAYLKESLKDNNYEFIGDAGNFIFIKPKTDANLIVKKMKEQKQILIKSYNGIGVLGKCLRVSTGEKKYMQQFLDALYELDK